MSLDLVSKFDRGGATIHVYEKDRCEGNIELALHEEDDIVSVYIIHKNYHSLFFQATLEIADGVVCQYGENVRKKENPATSSELTFTKVIQSSKRGESVFCIAIEKKGKSGCCNVVDLKCFTGNPYCLPEWDSKYEFPLAPTIETGYISAHVSKGIKDGTYYGDKGIDVEFKENAICFSVLEGTPVVVSRQGTVVLITNSLNDQKVVTIEHEDCTLATYGNLKKNVTVRLGDKLKPCQLLGYSSSSLVFYVEYFRMRKNSNFTSVLIPILFNTSLHEYVNIHDKCRLTVNKKTG